MVDITTIEEVKDKCDFVVSEENNRPGFAVERAKIPGAFIIVSDQDNLLIYQNNQNYYIVISGGFRSLYKPKVNGQA